jgi:hypothetical protein
MMDVWTKHMDPENNLHQSIALALSYSARAEDILDENHTVCAMPEEASHELQLVLLNFLCLFQSLHRSYLEMAPAVLLFSVTVKAHMLAHLAFACKHMNPVFGWCYMGEDFMRLMRKLTGACCKGNTPVQATRKLTVRWVRACDVTLRGSDVWK